MAIRHSTAHTTTSVSSSVKKNFGFTQWLQQAWGEVVKRCLRYLGSCNNPSIMYTCTVVSSILAIACQVYLYLGVKYTYTWVSRNNPSICTKCSWVSSILGCRDILRPSIDRMSTIRYLGYLVTTSPQGCYEIPKILDTLSNKTTLCGFSFRPTFLSRLSTAVSCLRWVSSVRLKTKISSICTQEENQGHLLG